MPKSCVLAVTCWLVRTFNEGGRVSDWFPYTFFATIDWQKNSKVAEYQLLSLPTRCCRYCFFLPFPVTSDFAMYIRKPRISGAVLVEARSMTYGDLGAKVLLSVLVVVSH